MKTGFFALFLLTFIIVSLTLFNIYFKNSAYEITEITKDAVALTNTGDYLKANENNQKAMKLWMKNEKKYQFLIEKTKLFMITAAFNEASTLFSQSRFEEFKTSLSALCFQLENLISENKLNSETIF